MFQKIKIIKNKQFYSQKRLGNFSFVSFGPRTNRVKFVPRIFQTEIEVVRSDQEEEGWEGERVAVRLGLGWD